VIVNDFDRLVAGEPCQLLAKDFDEITYTLITSAEAEVGNTLDESCKKILTSKNSLTGILENC
jgi:hypothetical protein